MVPVMFKPTERFTATIAAIDAANAEDPRLVEVDGRALPFELVYARRMSETMRRLYPDASELLAIAARAQHIRRWEIARSTYPLGRQGYERWRTACRENHAQLAEKLMSARGYSSDDVARVGSLIKKERLKKDADSQALENIVAVVFLAYYLNDFLAQHRDYDDDKIVGILAKTLNKMSAHGRAAAAQLKLSDRAQWLVAAAVARVGEAAPTVPR